LVGLATDGEVPDINRSRHFTALTAAPNTPAWPTEVSASGSSAVLKMVWFA
jgi:hypothetical protein